MRIVLGLLMAIFGLYATFEYSGLWKNERSSFFSTFGDFEGKKKGCQSGDADKCYSAALQLLNGVGVDKDEEEAIDFLKKSCTSDPLKGCLELGKLYFEGNGVKKSTKQAKAFLEKSCNGGLGDACAMLGIVIQSEKPKEFSAKAMDLIKKSCEKQESGFGCYALAQSFEAKRNYPKALELYDAGCELGSPMACLRASEIYGDGIVVERDFDKTIDYLKEACDYDLDQACYMAFEMEKSLTGKYHHTLRYEMKMGCNKGEIMSCAALKVIDFFSQKRSVI